MEKKPSCKYFGLFLVSDTVGIVNNKLLYRKSLELIKLYFLWFTLLCTVSGNITIWKDVVRYFANCGGCYIQGVNGIEIGNYSIFDLGVKMISANHYKNNFDIHDKGKPIKIGQNCWLRANFVILPEVELGDNVIVAAGSVVSKSLDNNLIIGGVPVIILKGNV